MRKKKEYLFNWIAENERIEKTLMRTADVIRYSHFRSSIRMRLDCSPRHMFIKKKKNDEKDEKETWRHRPETETLPNAEEEGRS